MATRTFESFMRVSLAGSFLTIVACTSDSPETSDGATGVPASEAAGSLPVDAMASSSATPALPSGRDGTPIVTGPAGVGSGCEAGSGDATPSAMIPSEPMRPNDRANSGGASGSEADAGIGTGQGGAAAPPGAGDSGTSVQPGETPEAPEVDPEAPLTAVAFFPSKDRTDTCADAAIGIEFNRKPVIGRGEIRIHDASGKVFDSVAADPQSDLYFSKLVSRSSAGQSFDSDVLGVVYDTVVFHPKGDLDAGATYYVTIDEGVITDELGTPFSIQAADEWSFTVRAQEPAPTEGYSLAADGSGDYCSLEGLLTALPDDSATPRVVMVKRGVYPGIVRMNDSNVHFQGVGIDETIFAHKNSATMNDSREGIVLTGSDVTFESLTIFNTYPADSNGQQAEALYVSESSQRVFLDDVHLRSHQDTLRIDGDSVYMRGGKISGSTDPLWGYGGFYCDGCELSSRTSGHAFVVARSTLGFALVNCSVTREDASVDDTYLAQYHDGSEPGTIAFVNCQIDDHVEGWRRPESNAWFEYGNTDLQSGNPVAFNGTQLNDDSPELVALASPENWLGWSP